MTGSGDDRRERIRKRKQKEMIRNGIVGAVLLIAALIAWSWYRNHVPAALREARAFLAEVKTAVEAAQVTDDEAGNAEALAGLEKYSAPLAAIPAEYTAECREAQALQERITAFKGQVEARSKELAYKRTAEAHLAMLTARFGECSENYLQLGSLAASVAEFRTAVADNAFTRQADDLAGRITARRLVIAADYLADGRKESRDLADAHRYGLAIDRLNQALEFEYPSELQADVTRARAGIAVLEQEADAFFSEELSRAQGLLDRDDYPGVAEAARDLYDLVGITKYAAQRDAFLVRVEQMRQERLEAARRAVERQLTEAQKLFGERKYQAACDMYAAVLKQVTNPDLLAEVNRFALTAGLYRNALDEIIDMLRTKGAFDLSQLGEMSGTLTAVDREGYTVQSGSTPITLGWKGFHETEFVKLLKMAADSERPNAALAYGVYAYKNNMPERAREWLDKGSVLSKDAYEDFAPLIDAIIAEITKPAAAEAAAADAPDAAATAPAAVTARKGPGLPDPGKVVLVTGHPRLFMRDRKIPGTDIPDLAEFKVLAGRGRRAKFKSNTLAHLENAAGFAARYILSNDAKAADKAIQMLQSPGMISETEDAADTSHGTFGWYNTARWLVPYSMAYDWLYDYPGFTADLKKGARKTLMDGHRDCMSWLGGGCHLGSNSAWIPLGGALASAIALYGEDGGVQSGFQQIERFLEKDVPPLFHELDGSWPEGWSYYTESADWVTVTLEMYRSFTGRDLWRLEYNGDYPYRQFMKGFIWALRGDHTYVRYGDIVGGQKASTAQHIAFYVQPCIRSTGDGELMWFLNEVERTWGHFAYTSSDGFSPYLHYGLVYGLADSGPRPEEPRALSEVMGRKSYGLVVMRSGWKPNDTFVSFRCGDYLGPGHCDYDSGHFEVFCRKGLALDSGYYATIGSSHYAEYHDRAIAHNVILAGEPGENGDEGDQRTCRNGTLHTVNDLLNSGANETGDIIAYEDTGTYVYAAGDVSRAYGAGITKWTRELVYIRPDILVICDRVKAGGDKEKRFLLHMAEEPTVAGRRITIRNEGCLEVVSLMPQDAKIRVIGGKGHEFWAKGKNWTQGIHGSGAEYDEPGAWRAEIYQPPGQTSTMFITAMTFGPSTVPCNAAMGRDALSVVVNGRMVSFSQAPGTVRVR